MRAFRTAWITHLTIASLAIVAALFVAHLGTHSHTDECHACEIAAHALADTQPATELAPQTDRTPPVPVITATTTLARPDTPASPRGPPLS